MFDESMELTERDLELIAWMLATAVENNPGDSELATLNAKILTSLSD
jgi:hypothetical protein